MEKWEYKSVTIKRLTDTSEMDEEGQDGWELICVLPSYNNCGYIGILKRKIIEEVTSKEMLND